MQLIYLYRVVIVSLSLYFIITRVSRFFKKERGQTIYKLLVTVGIWTGVSFAILFSDKIHTYTRKLGLGQNYNTLIFVIFIFVFLIIFKILSILEKIERAITTLVRKEALKKLLD